MIIATAIAGYLDSTVFNHFHHVVLGITFSSVDTLFTGAGILLIISGIYFRSNSRDVTLSKGIELPVDTTQELETGNENKAAESRLREHLTAVITLMKASTSWNSFYRLLQRALPKYKTELTNMEFPWAEEDE